MSRRTKQVICFSALVALPLMWNACGEVGFESGQKSSVLDSAGLVDVTQKINVTAQSSTKADILFVIDNSGSMQQEQIDIGLKISGFMNKIKDLDWRIALTTTSPSSNTNIDGTVLPFGDGQFRPFDSNTGTQYFLDSAQVNVAAAQTMLANAIYVGSKGSGDERGIHATYRALERAASPSPNRDFFRTDAAFAVVIISDEDECSSGHEYCGSNKVKSDPTKLIEFVKGTLGASKQFSVSAIIGIPNDSSCTSAPSRGVSYQLAQQLTGGSLGSICSNDYSAPLTVLGASVTELVKAASLQCPPSDFNNDGKADMQIIQPDGQVMKSGYTVKGITVTFDNVLQPGEYTFNYLCKAK